MIAAPAWRATLAMTAMELRLALRRGETLVATIVLPVVVLVFFSSIVTIPFGTTRPVDFLLPGSIAFAVIATSLVSLGITTAYDRYYGVLKRLGGSPLSRPELITAKIVAVLVVEAVQVALLVAVAALGLGWQAPAGASWGLVVVSVLLGTLAFAGIGLLLAGLLRAETMLAVANVLFVLSLVLGGIVVPIDHLPAPLAAIAGALPAAPLADALRVALGASPAPPEAAGRCAAGDLGRRRRGPRSADVPLGVAAGSVHPTNIRRRTFVQRTYRRHDLRRSRFCAPDNGMARSGSDGSSDERNGKITPAGGRRELVGSSEEHAGAGQGAGKGRTPVVGTGVLVESLVAGRGFEPLTFGL